MHCRVIRLRENPGKTEEAIKLYSSEILPTLKQQAGFAGATLVGNRETGEGMAVSYWETEKAMKDAANHIRPVAMKVMTATGGTLVSDDECEVAVMERFQAPKVGAWARVTSLKADPSHLDQGVADFKTKIVPALQRQPGVRAAFSFIDRQGGKTYAGSLWDTDKDLKASEPQIAELRAAAIKSLAGEGVKTEAFEVYQTEILAPAATSR